MFSYFCGGEEFTSASSGCQVLKTSEIISEQAESCNDRWIGTRLTFHVDSADAVIGVIGSNVIGSLTSAYEVFIRFRYVSIYHQHDYPSLLETLSLTWIAVLAVHETVNGCCQNVSS